MRQSWLAPAIFLALAVAIRAAEPVLPVFTDVTEPAGIQFKHSFGDLEMDNIVEGTGGGAVVFDYDNDGWLDIYLVNGRWQPDVSDNRGRNLRGKLRNKLYHNNHDGTFTDVTEKAGVAGKHYGCGCSAADYDGDGNLRPLRVCNYGADELYHNNGDGTFTDVTEEVGPGRSPLEPRGRLVRLQRRRRARRLRRQLPRVRHRQRLPLSTQPPVSPAP